MLILLFPVVYKLSVNMIVAVSHHDPPVVCSGTVCGYITHFTLRTILTFENCGTKNLVIPKYDLIQKLNFKDVRLQ